MLKIFLQFIISGFIVVLASYLANKIGQKWAGLLVAAPLLTLLTYVFLSMESSSTNYKEYLTSALIYMIPAAFFILSLLILSTRFNYLVNIGISFCVFAIVVVIIQKFDIV